MKPKTNLPKPTLSAIIALTLAIVILVIATAGAFATTRIIEKNTALEARFSEQTADVDSLRKLIAQLESDPAPASMKIAGATHQLASANLQNVVAEIFRQENVAINRSSPMTQSQLGDGEVGIQVRFEAEYARALVVLARLEANEPIFFLKELSLRSRAAPNAAPQRNHRVVTDVAVIALKLDETIT